MPAIGSRRAKRDGEARTSVPPAPPRPNEDAYLSPHHRQTREHGVNRFVYWTARAFLQPAIFIYFRLRRTGHKHIPKGPVILAANHRSFLDPFIVGACTFRPVYFVAKKELFDRRWQGWLLNRLGAFPVKRGQSDEEMMQTALTLLERGEAVVIFPEGTRHREGPLHEPRRGVGRLALESGAPVVPIAITGTEKARRGWRIRPVKVSIRCGRPLRYPKVVDPSPELAHEVTARIWPCVELQWAWLGGPLSGRGGRGGGSGGDGDAKRGDRELSAA
jgi:glycerol-3-phosphate dehydrogenase (NAD(P)+)